MGLAASQARFLGITARKSNIEYEGQQVNQQRTALAEEVNSLYNKLLSLKVPVAPDATEFYESKYTFSLSNTTGEDGDYTITSYYKTGETDDTYTIFTSWEYSQQGANGVKVNPSTISGNSTDGYKYSPADVSQAYTLTEVESPAATIALIKKSYPDLNISDDEVLYTYDDAKTSETFFFTKTDLENRTKTGATVSKYNIATKQFKETKKFENASIIFNENGKMQTVTVDGNTVSTNATRTHDDEGYQSALRDYTMDKEEYDKAVADLNAQTETLQQEDKVLELRLNQINTEQNELQTELDAVKEVLKKNIENTFNTFT